MIFMGIEILFKVFIPASNEPSDCLQVFGDCREGQKRETHRFHHRNSVFLLFS